MKSAKQIKICHSCRVKTVRTWKGYICPKCGDESTANDTIREFNNKLYAKKQECKAGIV
jgi:predicted RNA-binding Zn-ribbon protein involved in translation (DUF1610 family)